MTPAEPEGPAGAPAGLPAEPSTEFGRHCARAARTLAGFEGHFLHRIGYGVQGDGDTLEITLVDGPEKPEAVVELGGVLTFELTKPDELSGTFADDITVRHLGPHPAPWPPEAVEHRLGGAQELVQLRLHGPARVHVIARRLTVYVAEPYGGGGAPGQARQ